MKGCKLRGSTKLTWNQISDCPNKYQFEFLVKPSPKPDQSAKGSPALAPSRQRPWNERRTANHEPLTELLWIYFQHLELPRLGVGVLLPPPRPPTSLHTVHPRQTQNRHLNNTSPWIQASSAQASPSYHPSCDRRDQRASMTQGGKSPLPTGRLAVCRFLRGPRPNTSE